MKLFKRLRRQSFTLVELLVVITIIGILASFALPALTGAITKAQLIQSVSNIQQVQAAAQQAALDSIQTGSSATTWPADMTSPGDSAGYLTKLLNAGYLKSGDLRILAATGVTALTGTAITTIAEANTPFHFGNVSDTDEGSAYFVFTKNWKWSSGVDATKKPCGAKGFVICHKAGDAQSYQTNQATATDGSIGTVPANGTDL